MAAAVPLAAMTAYRMYRMYRGVRRMHMGYRRMRTMGNIANPMWRTPARNLNPLAVQGAVVASGAEQIRRGALEAGFFSERPTKRLRVTQPDDADVVADSAPSAGDEMTRSWPGDDDSDMSVMTTVANGSYRGQMRTNGRMGRIGKGRRYRPGNVRRDTARIHYSCIDSVVHDDATAWFGYQHQQRDQIFEAFAHHLFLRICSRCKCDVVGYDSIPMILKHVSGANPSVRALEKVRLFFRAVNYSKPGTTGTAPNITTTGGDEQENAYSDLVGTAINGKTFSEMVALIKAELDTRAAQGYVFYRYDVYEYDYSSSAANFSRFMFQEVDLDKARCELMVRFKAKMQNITPASGTDDVGLIDNIAANPLSGTSYDFTAPTPRFRGQWVEETPIDVANYNPTKVSVTDDIETSGTLDESKLGNLNINDNGAACFRDGSSNLVAPFRVPIRQCDAVFSNLSHTGNFVMKPGGFQTLDRTFAFRGTIRQLMLGLYGVSSTQPFHGDPRSSDQRPYARTGHCTLMCVRHLMRDNVLDGGAQVKLVVNKDYYYSFSFTKPKKKPLPVHQHVV